MLILLVQPCFEIYQYHEQLNWLVLVCEFHPQGDLETKGTILFSPEEDSKAI